MVEFTLEAAGIPVGVRALFAGTKDYCRKFLTQAAPAFSVEITPADLDLEREKTAKEEALEGLPVRDPTDAQLELTAVLRKVTQGLLQKDVLLFHGSVVAVDGNAYLFTAKSGTGKSTHTRLWRQLLGERAVMVNDDKPFLQITEQGIIAWGSPWNGKHDLSSRMGVPLKAICILERSPENRICRIPAAEAVKMLIQQSSRPRDGQWLPKYLELVDRLSAGVTFYRMGCNMDIQAAEMAYGAMRE